MTDVCLFDLGYILDRDSPEFPTELGKHRHSQQEGRKDRKNLSCLKHPLLDTSYAGHQIIGLGLWANGEFSPWGYYRRLPGSKKKKAKKKT